MRSRGSTLDQDRVVLGSIVGGLLGGMVGFVGWRWQLARRRRSAAAGARFEVPAKLRLARKGCAGRWREGFMSRDGEGLRFRPRKPRPGPIVGMTGSTISGTRPAKLTERWWFNGPTVLLGSGPQGDFELGLSGGADYEALARQVFEQ